MFAEAGGGGFVNYLRRRLRSVNEFFHGPIGRELQARADFIRRAIEGRAEWPHNVFKMYWAMASAQSFRGVM